MIPRREIQSVRLELEMDGRSGGWPRPRSRNLNLAGPLACVPRRQRNDDFSRGIPDESSSHLVPFLVVDRQASLRIVRKIPFRHYGGPIGLMTHANTTLQFQTAFRRFPREIRPDSPKSPSGGPMVGRPRLSERRLPVIKVCDSGVFTKEGCTFDYDALFETYSRMGCDYGIIIDVMRNPQATLDSAREAIRTYRQLSPSFRLVGVTQGRSVREYVDCYRRLRKLGFKFIAVGGMLAKRPNTAHYTYVEVSRGLFQTLEAIRSRYPKDWLFALGCYHPKRHLAMERLGVFGSDYKGWIFNYTKRPDLSTHRARLSRYNQVRSFLSRAVFDGPLYLNGASIQVAEAREAGKVLGIVSCGVRKVWATRHIDGPVAARDAYTGPLFGAGREYVERFSDSWAILSAKYGLIPPTFRIRGDYNQRLSWPRNSSRALELRRQLLALGLHRFSKVVVVGGQDYVEAIADAYAGTGIPVYDVRPKPLRIGQTIHLLKRAVTSGKPLTPRLAS
jgi:hypothetical protein